MSEQRDVLKQSQSKPGFLEINKIVAQKWAQLEPSEKQKYLEAAAADRVRWAKLYFVNEVFFIVCQIVIIIIISHYERQDEEFLSRFFVFSPSFMIFSLSLSS